MHTHTCRADPYAHASTLQVSHVTSQKQFPLWCIFTLSSNPHTHTHTLCVSGLLPLVTVCVCVCVRPCACAAVVSSDLQAREDEGRAPPLRPLPLAALVPPLGIDSVQPPGCFRVNQGRFLQPPAPPPPPPHPHLLQRHRGVCGGVNTVTPAEEVQNNLLFLRAFGGQRH